MAGLGPEHDCTEFVKNLHCDLENRLSEAVRASAARSMVTVLGLRKGSLPFYPIILKRKWRGYTFCCPPVFVACQSEERGDTQLESLPTDVGCEVQLAELRVKT